MVDPGMVQGITGHTYSQSLEIPTLHCDHLDYYYLPGRMEKKSNLIISAKTDIGSFLAA